MMHGEAESAKRKAHNRCVPNVWPQMHADFLKTAGGQRHPPDSWIAVINRARHLVGQPSTSAPGPSTGGQPGAKPACADFALLRRSSLP